MKTLTFDDIDAKSISLNSISKSFLNTYNQCKLKAKLKKETYEEDTSRALSIGKASHEYFARECSKIMGVDSKMNLTYSPSILKTAKEMALSVDYDKLTSGGKMTFVEKRISVTLPSKVNLVGIFDLVIYCMGEKYSDEFFGDYIKIVDYKTSFSVSKEIDDEALIYAYLAAKYFQSKGIEVPIVFSRISGSSGDYWEHYFTVKEALSYENLINEYSLSVKKVIEGREYPFPTVGAHCTNCPFLDKCISKGYEQDDVDEMITEMVLHESKAKALKLKIQNMASENDGEYKSEVYTAKIEKSKTPKLQIKKEGKIKAVNKKEFINMLAESGELDDIISSLDVKYTPEVLAKAEKLGFTIGENTRSSMKIENTYVEVPNEE